VEPQVQVGQEGPKGFALKDYAFVVVSGIPGSGKTTLAHQLAPHLALPVVDKDDFLERLLTTNVHGIDRRRLSRESDRLFQQAARDAGRAILVSFWHVNGMQADSGTAVGWLAEAGVVAHVHCVCEPAIAVQRFVARRRHSGHNDAARSTAQLRSEFQRLIDLGPPALGSPILVDTTAAPSINEIVSAIRARLPAG